MMTMHVLVTRIVRDSQLRARARSVTDDGSGAGKQAADERKLRKQRQQVRFGLRGYRPRPAVPDLHAAAPCISSWRLLVAPPQLVQQLLDLLDVDPARQDVGGRRAGLLAVRRAAGAAAEAP